MMKNIFATGFLKSKICEIFGKHAWAGPPQDVHGCSRRGRVTFTIVIIAVVASFDFLINLCHSATKAVSNNLPQAEASN